MKTLAMLAAIGMASDAALSHASPDPRIPADSWDSHNHVTDPSRFPPLPDSPYTPGVHTVWDQAIFEHGVGCDHIVLIQPSIYGTDNTMMLQALAAYGPERGRAVVVFNVSDGSVTEDDLLEWNALGVRGVRLNFASTAATPDPEELEKDIRAYADAIGHLGWVIQLYINMEHIPLLEEIIPTLDIQVVFDHLGNPSVPENSTYPNDPYELNGFSSLARLLEQGNTWAKISAPYRLSNAPGPIYEDLDPITLELFRLAPSRLVIATDWPHTRFDDLDIQPWISHVLDLTGDDQELRDKLFRDNAEKLWSGGRNSSQKQT